MENKETRKKFMRMLNKYIDDLKTGPDYNTVREIFNIKDNSEYVIDPQMMEYDNDNRKDTKEENALISTMRNIGKRMQRTSKKAVNYGDLYFELNNNTAFKRFFNNNNINEDDMYKFSEYILQDYKTKSVEQHEKQNAKEKERQQAMKQENETLKEEKEILTEENKKKDNKIERRDRRIERRDNKIKKNEEEIINLNKQIEDERKQAEEEKRNIQAEAKRNENEKVARMKHKMEERHEKNIEENLNEYRQNETEIYGFTPTLEAYIKKKLQSKAYSLDEDELIEKIARDIGKPGGLPKGTDPKELAKAIYNRGAEETIKHIKKIANLAILTGYNHDLYNKLPGDVAEEVQRYITDKINDDIRRKNIKYILPKDKPRWEHAMESKQLNPMLGRSAWRVN